MKLSRLPVFVLLFLLPAMVFAQGKKKHMLPAIFNSARYVYVESVDGDIYSPGLSRADRDAIGDLQSALRSWGRYIVTTNRSEAELVFVLRTGRTSENKIGGGGGIGVPGPVPNNNPSQQPRTGPPGVMLGEEGGTPDDVLQVCMLSEGSKLSAPIWMRTQTDGLAIPDLPLFRDLRKEIDKDYPVAPPPPKP